jgi:TolA-binding protein
MPFRRFIPLTLCCALGLTAAALPQAARPGGSGEKKEGAIGGAELELCERLIIARREYQKMLEQLRHHYLTVANDPEKARWAEEELRQYHRIPKQAFILDLEVPPDTLRATVNIPEANELFKHALKYKGKGSGVEHIDNQRRAELLLQRLITQYPQSTRIGDAAYQLGDIYENRPYRHIRRAALFFERCFQWNPTTNLDARMRAARLYDRYNIDRAKAIELYRQVGTHESNPAHHDEADKRLKALSGAR